MLLSPCPATRNLSFLRFHRHRHPVVSTRCFTGLVRVGVKIPQDGNRANMYAHVAMVPEHVWRTVCSVFATGARVGSARNCRVIRNTVQQHLKVFKMKKQLNFFNSNLVHITLHHAFSAHCSPPAHNLQRNAFPSANNFSIQCLLRSCISRWCA